MTAPQTRFVDQFTGRLAGRPSKFFQANEQADAFLAELDRLRRDNSKLVEQAQGLAEAYERLVEDNAGLRCRNAELEAERVVVRRELDALKAEMAWESMP